VDPASVVLVAARRMTPAPVGLLLLAAAVVVVISTGMNYLLSPSTNIMRDIYQRFINPGADQKKMVALQKIFIVVLGLCAFLMIFVPTALKLNISVLKYSYFAYTMYGVAITPALLAADKGETIAWGTEPTRQLSGVAGVAEQPRCIVQRMARTRTNSPSVRAELPQASTFAYQVTARGVGANRNTVVVLQSSFIRD
jgi:hypothetical protein